MSQPTTLYIWQCPFPRCRRILASVYEAELKNNAFFHWRRHGYDIKYPDELPESAGTKTQETFTVKLWSPPKKEGESR